jgi:hypothetical protein
MLGYSPRERPTGEAVMPEEFKEIRFLYRRARDYRVIAANGAWGGVAANGVVAMDLYVERDAQPEAVVRQVEGLHLGPEEPSPSEPGVQRVERESQVGVLLTADTARAVGKWLLDQADELDLQPSTASATRRDAEAAVQFENTRQRILDALSDPDLARLLEEATRADQSALEDTGLVGEVLARARKGEFAEESFVAAYGAEFMSDLKPDFGG